MVVGRWERCPPCEWASRAKTAGTRIPDDEYRWTGGILQPPVCESSYLEFMHRKGTPAWRSPMSHKLPEGAVAAHESERAQVAEAVPSYGTPGQEAGARCGQRATGCVCVTAR